MSGDGSDLCSFQAVSIWGFRYVDPWRTTWLQQHVIAFQFLEEGFRPSYEPTPPSRVRKMGLSGRNRNPRQLFGNGLRSFFISYNMLKCNARLNKKRKEKRKKSSAVDLDVYCTEEVIDVDPNVELLSDDDTSMDFEIVENLEMEVEGENSSLVGPDVELLSDDDTSMGFKIVENVKMEVEGEKSSLVVQRTVTDDWGSVAFRKDLKSAENQTLKLKGKGFSEVEDEKLMIVDVDDDDDCEANEKSELVVDPQPVTDVQSFDAYRKVLQSAENRTSKVKDKKGFGKSFKERYHRLIQSVCSLYYFFIRDEEDVEDVRLEPFLPLSKEDEIKVKKAFSANNNRNILVIHKSSNIDITGEKLKCLKPGQWLNDEVINLYLILLKEREAREPKKFLNCHFFNTFFFTKLVKSGSEYNYGAVKRWTSMKKLGYHLLHCDKIFVPIHMNIHWTLAVINIKDKKFQYLDSFKGREPKILDTLARYFVDEVRDKSERDIDVSRWKKEFVRDLPEQRNGFDCGMFMLKYIDFYSRGLDLCFAEEQMPYFRVRTSKEILQLKAE